MPEMHRPGRRPAETMRPRDTARRHCVVDQTHRPGLRGLVACLWHRSHFPGKGDVHQTQASGSRRRDWPSWLARVDVPLFVVRIGVWGREGKVSRPMKSVRSPFVLAAAFAHVGYAGNTPTAPHNTLVVSTEDDRSGGPLSRSHPNVSSRLKAWSNVAASVASVSILTTRRRRKGQPPSQEVVAENMTLSASPRSMNCNRNIRDSPPNRLGLVQSSRLVWR